MIFDHLDIRLISPQETQHIDGAAASGSVALHADAAEQPIVGRLCSGFLISRLHVLTAAHCVRSGLVFDQTHLVSGGEASSLEIVAFGQTVRLQIRGASLPPRHDGAGIPALAEPSYENPVLDFAVLGLPEPTSSSFVDLAAVAATADGEGSEEVRLYGFPNGMPLSEAFNCRTAPSPLEDTLLHDCDTLPGSSGGLLVSAVSGLGVAMHVGSTRHNELSYFEAAGRFESPADLRATMCDPAEKAPAPAPACFEGPAYNRAVKLTSIARDLQRRAPEVWSSILDNSSAHPPLGRGSM